MLDYVISLIQQKHNVYTFLLSHMILLVMLNRREITAGTGRCKSPYLYIRAYGATDQIPID